MPLSTHENVSSMRADVSLFCSLLFTQVYYYCNESTQIRLLTPLEPGLFFPTGLNCLSSGHHQLPPVPSILHPRAWHLSILCSPSLVCLHAHFPQAGRNFLKHISDCVPYSPAFETWWGWGIRDGSGCPKANNTKLAWLKEEGGPERLLQLSRGSWW